MLSLILLGTSLPAVIPQAHAAAAVDFSNLVEQVSDGVVRISITKRVSEEELAMVQQAKILRQFFGNRVEVPELPAIEQAYGTGFFITADGYILTNHHVVEGADTITVTMNDRTEMDAKLIGSDASSDIAVLKVVGNNFPVLTTAKDDNLRVGEPVLAIGSPFGFDYSASAGIVSAKSRNFSKEAAVPFIQSDVALNPGNSGGPLFNQKGEVVGVNSRIFSGTGGHMGLSFSIPIDTAMSIYEQIKATGRVTRVYLGVSVQDLDRNLAEAYGLSRPRGALLTSILDSSPADKLGLKRGDLVLEFNGTSIVHASDLLNLINRARPDDNFALTYKRGNDTRTVRGKFAEVPKDISANASEHRGVRLGLNIKTLSENERAMLANFGIDGGMLVTDIDVMGLAARSGVQAGDVIISLNQQPTRTPNDFSKAIQTLPTTGVVTMELIRGGSPAIIGLRIE